MRSQTPLARALFCGSHFPQSRADLNETIGRLGFSRMARSNTQNYGCETAASCLVPRARTTFDANIIPRGFHALSAHHATRAQSRHGTRFLRQKVRIERSAPGRQ